MPQTEDDATGINVTKAVKLPQPFWRENPVRYFTIAEMTFALHRITSDDTKFKYLVIHLDPDLLNIVGDIIDAPPSQGKYEALKQRIINSLSESQETRLRRLIRGQAIGNDKPSVFLQRLRNLAGGQCNDNVLRSLFMEQLPDHIRGILAVSQTEDLAAIALQADRIFETTQPILYKINQVPLEATSLPINKCAIGEPKSISAQHEFNDVNTQLLTAVEKLTKQLKQVLRTRDRSQSRSRTKNNERYTPTHNQEGQTLCYYHQRYGANARRCRAPCTWGKETDNTSKN